MAGTIKDKAADAGNGVVDTVKNAGNKIAEGAEKAVFMLSEEVDTVREDESVDVNQIRELIRMVEASDIEVARKLADELAGTVASV